MTSSVKCRAKNPAACTDPNCPAKRTDKAAFFADLQVNKRTAAKNGSAKKKSVDTALVLPSFQNEDEIMAYIAKQYGGKVEYDISRSEGFASTEYLSVDKIVVAPELRGQGIAPHIRKILQQYADQQNLVITGNPTYLGNGTVEKNLRSKAFKAHALAHREYLEQAYFKTGYVHNPFYEHRNEGQWRKSGKPKDIDPMTGKLAVRDFIARSQFTSQATFFLKRLDEFVYFPNGRVPEWMLAPGGKFDARGYHRMPDVATRAGQDEAHRIQYQAQLAREAKTKK